MSWLLFRMDLSDDPIDQMIFGKLFVMDNNAQDPAVPPFKVTSGVRSAQAKGDQSLRGLGPIPANRKVGLSGYSVRTTPFDERGVPGIDGNFYYIEPDPVTVDGITRSEFGIHNDANRDFSPGSAGCIVLSSNPEWARFEGFMTSYRKKGFAAISLIVEYNSPKPLPQAKQFLSVTTPKPGERFKLGDPIKFEGTAEPEVKKIIATVGPGGPFKIGQVETANGKWSFSHPLVTAGTRPVKISAFDSEGNLLGQTTEFQIFLDS
jgi:hypothetical protein